MGDSLAEGLEDRENRLRAVAQDIAARILSGEIGTPEKFNEYFNAAVPEFAQAEQAQGAIRADSLGLVNQAGELLGIPLTEHDFYDLTRNLREKGVFTIGQSEEGFSITTCAGLNADLFDDFAAFLQLNDVNSEDFFMKIREFLNRLREDERNEMGFDELLSLSEYGLLKQFVDYMDGKGRNCTVDDFSMLNNYRLALTSYSKYAVNKLPPGSLVDAMSGRMREYANLVEKYEVNGHKSRVLTLKFPIINSMVVDAKSTPLHALYAIFASQLSPEIKEGLLENFKDGRFGKLFSCYSSYGLYMAEVVSKGFESLLMGHVPQEGTADFAGYSSVTPNIRSLQELQWNFNATNYRPNSPAKFSEVAGTGRDYYFHPAGLRLDFNSSPLNPLNISKVIKSGNQTIIFCG